MGSKMIRYFVLGAVLGAAITASGCGADVQQNDLEKIVENLKIKHKERQLVRDYREIKPIVIDILKEVTGEDVSDIRGRVAGQRHFTRIFGDEGYFIAGYYEHLRRNMAVKQSGAVDVLKFAFHECGHDIIEHINKSNSFMIRNAKSTYLGAEKNSLKYPNPEKIEGMPQALLMEEVGATTVERLGMLVTFEKYYKNGELGEYLAITTTSKSIEIHAVADDICNDIITYLVREEGGKPIDAVKKMFPIVRDNDFSGVVKYLTPKTLEKVEKLFEEMQKPEYEY